MNLKITIYKIVIALIIALSTILPFDENIKTAFIIIAYLIVGYDVLFKAIKNIFKGNVLDENFLMSIATVGALFINEATEALLVMLFYQVGEAFQTYAVNKSRSSITELMAIKAEYANVIRDNVEQKINPEDILIDEIIIIKPGEKIPLDGFIIEGNTLVDTSSLTGESLPLELKQNNEVLAGYVNLNGLIKVRVDKLYVDSTVSKILELVENASIRKSKSEKFITKFARYYTPIVVVSALLLAVIPPLLNMGDFSDWLYRALSFLVVSCPCALVISIPLGFFGGIGGAAKQKVLVKGGNYLEALANTEIVVFDKTGTLTKGEFSIDTIYSVNNNTNEVLEYAVIAETNSNHPIAKAIVKSKTISFDQNDVKDVEEIFGHGVKLNYQGNNLLVGNYKLLKDNGVELDNIQEAKGSVVYVAKNKEYLGYLILRDQLKENAKAVIEKLNRLNFKTVMLTGDKISVAKEIQKELNMSEIKAELLPHEKVDNLEALYGELKDAKGKIVYIGDGINDAPVLARADIGISMGQIGSEAAIEAADIVIMNDDLNKLITAIEISKKTLGIVKQNIILAFSIKLAVLLLAGFGHSTLLEAIFADVGVAVLAILNSMRAMKFKEKI